MRLRCARLPRKKSDWLCCCVSQDFCGRPLAAGSHSESRLRPDRRRVECCKLFASKEVPRAAGISTYIYFMPSVTS